MYSPFVCNWAINGFQYNISSSTRSASRCKYSLCIDQATSLCLLEYNGSFSCLLFWISKNPFLDPLLVLFSFCFIDCGLYSRIRTATQWSLSVDCHWIFLSWTTL